MFIQDLGNVTKSVTVTLLLRFHYRYVTLPLHEANVDSHRDNDNFVSFLVCSLKS